MQAGPEQPQYVIQGATGGTLDQQQQPQYAIQSNGLDQYILQPQYIQSNSGVLTTAGQPFYQTTSPNYVYVTDPGIQPQVANYYNKSNQ